MADACGIYARISRDDQGDALGVARQLEDCEREAERRGWPVVRRYVDNDVSAYSGKSRPEYTALLADVEAGAVDAVIVWDVDRLTRTPAELESFIDLADRHRLSLASIGGEVDLSTPQGRLTARIKGSVARHEVEQQSRRLRRKFQANAAAGVPHGPIPFGYRMETDRDERGKVTGRRYVIVEDEAALLRDWYARVIAGETLRSIAKEAAANGVRSRGGKVMEGVSIGRMLRRPLYIGQRVHKGEVIGPGQWEPIVDEGTWSQAVAVLSDPNRVPTRGPEPRYLGSGIYRCGRCGTGMRPIVSAQDKPGSRPPTYGCPGCNRLARKMEPVDEVVNAVMVARLSRPDTVLDLAADPGKLREAIAHRDGLTARLDTAADQFAEGTITARQLTRITERLTADLTEAERRVASLQPSRVLDGMTGPGAAEAWHSASLEKRRTILRELVTITIQPTGPGIRFEPEQVTFEWRAT